MIISQTPFRVSFFGGGTDFPGFFSRHGGSTLLTTINQYCYLSVHPLSGPFQHRMRASYAETETVTHPSEFKHPLIRECFLHFNMTDALELAHVSDLPGRTGLGTSSSFTVGLLSALHHLRGEEVCPEDLAREAILIERTKVGDPGGYQDQYAAAYGGFLRLDFSGDARVDVKRLPLTRGRTSELESQLLLFYTGMKQSAAAVLKEQKSRFETNEDTLCEMKAMVDDAESILTGNGSLDPFGDLLHESWQRKKTLASGITNSTIDEAYEAARAVGARGGKLLGAGGRGFLLVYADPQYREAIIEKLKPLALIDMRFSNEGSRVIFGSASSS